MLLERRRSFLPSYPEVLSDVASVRFVEDRTVQLEPTMKEVFPNLKQESVIRCVAGDTRRMNQPLRVGVVFSGGPAPGGHNVIAGLYDAMKQMHADSCLIGFQGGLGGLIGDKKKTLGSDEIALVRNCGGFDLLGTGRGTIQSSEDLARARKTMQSNSLDALIIIGGDDSNTDAAYLANSPQMKTTIVGVPKTIDGDLQSFDIPVSFGFDTACSVYSEIIGNIAKDILSTKKYYFFVRLMGRETSHITLEIALRIRPNMALISEEIEANGSTIQDVVLQICDLVEERLKEGKKYGLILLPEGIIGCFSDIRRTIANINDLLASMDKPVSVKEGLKALDEESKRCFESFPAYMKEELVYERDPHGNMHVSKIETERLLAHLVERELERRKIPFSAQTEFCGYEGRSAFPSNFDCNYCYALGRLALALASQGKNGYIAAIRDLHKNPKEWVAAGVPLVSLMHFEHRLGKKMAVIQKTKVDLHGQPFALFDKERASWRVSDQYRQPGPMQFVF